MKFALIWSCFVHLVEFDDVELANELHVELGFVRSVFDHFGQFDDVELANGLHVELGFV